MKKLIFTIVLLTSIVVNAQNQFANPFDNNKANWIKENPEKYKSMSNSRELNEPDKIEQAASSLTVIIERPDFPIYIETGNREEDYLRYQIEKQDWISKITAINEFNGVYFQSKESKENWIIRHPNEYYTK